MIYVDADACPVKAEAERVAERHGLRMFVVSNGGIRPSRNPLVEAVIVPDGPDVADMWIAERVGRGGGIDDDGRASTTTKGMCATPRARGARGGDTGITDTRHRRRQR